MQGARVLLCGLLTFWAGAAMAQPMPDAVERWRPAAIDSPGAALLAELRRGGMVLFFRHADTSGMPCDRSFQLGDREGQRNISPLGEQQSRRVGELLRAMGVRLQLPVLAGPVFRARDTAEAAFGAPNVTVTDSLLADDYAGGRLEWVLAEHRRLFSTRPQEPGTNVVLVGHRTPAIMVLGHSLGGQALPEGATVVLRPQGDGRAQVAGVLVLVPLAWLDMC